MQGKKWIFSILGIIGLGATSFVYSNFYKDENVVLKDIFTQKVFVDNPFLSETFVAFSAQKDISKYSLQSACDAKSQFEAINKEGNYIFSLNFFEKDCKNPNFYLKDEEGKIVLNSLFQVKAISEYDLWNEFVDVSSQDLEKAKNKLEELEQKMKKYGDISPSFDQKELFQKKFTIKEIVFRLQIIESILSSRSEKYAIPITGYSLPSRETKLPNSKRPYRADYTNGIHEGWDLDAAIGTPVVSIDDGVILRVVKGFVFEDLEKLELGNTLSHNQKIQNLDILRGNQVWIKTAKGDVIFYSHLSEVNPNISEGQRVKKTDVVGKVGITGVPDKNYTDSHLHFELRKNPYNLEMAGKYLFQDYMNWDWYFKGRTAPYIQQNQYTIFQK